MIRRGSITNIQWLFMCDIESFTIWMRTTTNRMRKTEWDLSRFIQFAHENIKNKTPFEPTHFVAIAPSSMTFEETAKKNRSKSIYNAFITFETRTWIVRYVRARPISIRHFLILRCVHVPRGTCTCLVVGERLTHDDKKNTENSVWNNQ